MNKNKRYPGIDGFRLAAAFLIVAIHTAPLEDISPGLDYLVTYCLGRVAVPFFLMVTGYFLLARYPGKSIKPYLCRLMVLYVAATLFYLPVTVYAGNMPKEPGGWIKWFLMDGSFYHLWYLPAALTGCLITAALLRLGNYWLGTVIVCLLYLTGLLGDSWYGAVEGLKTAEGFYQAVFTVTTYTRNGIFLAPIFLWLGAMLGKDRVEKAERTQGKSSLLWIGISLAVCLILMMVEGGITKGILWQRHNSMYMLLPAAVTLLFILLLEIKGREWKNLPALSMWVYLLHPMCIVMIRGIAGFLKLDWLLVDNSLVFFLAVCTSSLVSALCLNGLRHFVQRKLKKQPGKPGASRKGESNVSKRKSMDRT